MNFIPTFIPGVYELEPKVFGDHRGFFLETYRTSDFIEHGINPTFVQDNHSGSLKGILRGLHYQIQHPQGKLVRVIAGEIFDVAVDLRKSSPTLGKWIGITLSAEKKNQLWIPKGLAHGFYVTSDWAEVIYKATDYYAPESERTLLWNDPEIKVEWPIPSYDKPILSTKDQQGKPFNEIEFYDL